MTIDELRNKLETERHVTVSFIKKDGSTRVMNCTLHHAVIPETTGSSVPPEGMLTVWDLDKEAWRTLNTNTAWNIVT